MTKNQQQNLFLKDAVKLLSYADDYCDKNGALVTFGETVRTPLQAWANSMPPNTILQAKTPDGKVYTYGSAVGGVGILKSKHLEGLAIDLNYIKDGEIVTDKELLKPIADYWQALSPENRAGLYFSKPDFPHSERNV